MRATLTDALVEAIGTRWHDRARTATPREGEPERTTAGRARSFISRLTDAGGLDVVVGALVISAYAVAQLGLLQGPHSYDPAKYFRNGADFPAVGADYWTLRVGLMVPIRAAVAVVGPSEAALYAVPILSGALLAAAVYATMLLLFGKRVVAAAAALVTVLNPSYLLNSSHIFPDVTATTTFSLGFLCLVLAADYGEWLAGARPRAVAAGVAGFLFGWTYLTREFSPLLLPTVAAAVVLLRYPVRRVVVLAFAAVATFSLELLYGLVRYGDAFIRTRELLARGDARIAPHRTQRMDHIQGQLGDLGDTILVLPRLLLAWETGWTLVALIGVFALALALVRDRRLWLLGVWFLWYWAALAVIGLLSQPSGAWLLNITNVRYWYLLFPPLVMGAFGGIELLARRYAPRAAAALVAGTVAVVVAASVLVPGIAEYSRCKSLDVWRSMPAARFHELRSWLATPGAARYDVIRTDPRTYRLLPVYVRTTFGDVLWEGDLRRVRPVPLDVVPAEDAARSLVLFHNARSVPRHHRMRLGALRDWTRVFVSSDGRMIVLSHAPATRVRRPPARPEAGASSRRTAPDGAATRCGRSPYERHA